VNCVTSIPFSHTSSRGPGAERRIFPVVLDEAHVVLLQVEAERLERAEIEVEDVRGEGFSTTWYW